MLHKFEFYGLRDRGQIRFVTLNEFFPERIIFLTGKTSWTESQAKLNEKYMPAGTFCFIAFSYKIPVTSGSK